MTQILRQAPDPTPEEIAYQIRMQRLRAVQQFCYQLAAIYPKARWPQAILNPPGHRVPKLRLLTFEFNGPPPKHQRTVGEVLNDALASAHADQLA